MNMVFLDLPESQDLDHEPQPEPIDFHAYDWHMQ